MKKIKILALDVDGTLTFDNRLLDLEGVKAVRKASENGLIVILTSGIPVQGLRPVSGLLGASEYLIGENGGVIFDGENIEVLSSAEKAKKCFEELKKKLAGVEVYSKADTRLSEVCLKLGPDVKEIEKIASKYGLKVVATGFAIHLTTPGVNKGMALKRIAKKLGFTLGECAAVGDSMNDIEMVQDSGVGIAVANARDELKKVAEFVTKESFGKGASEAVEYVLRFNKSEQTGAEY